jgi:hypothetical protein
MAYMAIKIYKNATSTYKSWYFMVEYGRKKTTSPCRQWHNIVEILWKNLCKNRHGFRIDFWSSAGCSGSVQTAEQGGWAKNGLNIHPAGERSAPGNPTDKHNRLADHDSTGVPTHDSMYIQLYTNLTQRTLLHVHFGSIRCGSVLESWTWYCWSNIRI